MTYGRKDYFWGVAPEKSVFGELQTAFQKWTAGSCLAEASVDFFNYTIPAGYILNITGIMLGSRLSGISQFYIYEDATIHGSSYFDTSLNVVFGQGGEVVLEPGSVFKINIFNHMDYATFYALYAYGFFQQTIV